MAQRVKDLVLSLQRLSLLWCGFDPWLGNFHLIQVWPKKEREKENHSHVRCPQNACFSFGQNRKKTGNYKQHLNSEPVLHELIYSKNQKKKKKKRQKYILSPKQGPFGKLVS